MRSSFLRPAGSQSVAAWLLLLLCAHGRPVSAAEPCPVEVSGPEGAAWQAAVAELDVELRSRSVGSSCARVQIDAANGQALLTYTSLDGRRAERWIEDPIELVPTVQALSVSAPAMLSSEAPTEAAAAASSPRKPALEPSPALDSAQPGGTGAQPSPYVLSPIFGVQAGFRAGANSLISPSLGGTVALMANGLELGLLARYEAHYVVASGGNEGRPETSGVVVGATFGFRQPVGTLALRGGASLLLAALHEDNGGKDGRAEGRIGVYAGGVFPRESSTRLRLDLGAELVPYNIGQSELNAERAWSLPWWAITFAFGAEFG